MGNFLAALKVVIDHEFPANGDPDSYGVIIVRGDKGGPTTYLGVTFDTFKDALGSKADLDGDGSIDLKDFQIFARSKDEQIEVLHRRYWIVPGFDNIRNLRVATKMLDMAVNMGPRAAVVLLQRAVNHVQTFGRERLKEDGDLGPKTLAAVATCDPDLLVPAICAEQKTFYCRIIERDPTQQKFKAGWLARAKWGEVAA